MARFVIFELPRRGILHEAIKSVVSGHHGRPSVARVGLRHPAMPLGDGKQRELPSVGCNEYSGILEDDVAVCLKNKIRN
jgi:hypothetical protein